ncbi:MAG: NfeD family protein [Planctomycetota bacterium]
MTQLIIFATIAGAFFLLMVGGFLLGHDHDHDYGHVHVHDYGGDTNSVSMFSFRVLSIFGLGFGTAGAIATQFGMSFMRSSLYGVGLGLLLGFTLYSLLNLFSRQQSTSIVETHKLIGCTGLVTVEIGADSLGEVALNFAGNYRNFNAQSVQNVPIQKGASVMVIQTEGSRLIVEAYPPN